MLRNLILILWMVTISACKSEMVKKEYKGGVENFKEANIVIAPVEKSSLIKIERPGEFILHLPANNDWLFTPSDEKNIFTASSLNFGFNVSFWKDTSLKQKINQEKYLASVGQFYTQRGMKLENGQITMVEPSKNNVMSYSHSMLEGHFVSWFFMTVRQSNKNNDVYTLEIRKLNPPPEHFKQLKIALNDLLANGFSLSE
jgi:hypothetical protein